jgi:oligopeptide/dipeptide ABC transporter ATP-binding protein
MLLDSVPDIDMTGRERVPIAGENPNPINPPPGCHFHPRCPLAFERCRVEAPALLPVANGHAVACHAVAGGEG